VEAVRQQLKAFLIAHERDLQPYASLFGERELAEAMMRKLPGVH
jgi:hypothetical protein